MLQTGLAGCDGQHGVADLRVPDAAPLLHGQKIFPPKLERLECYGAAHRNPENGAILQK
jgi:hypothetical protein